MNHDEDEEHDRRREEGKSMPGQYPTREDLEVKHVERSWKVTIDDDTDSLGVFVKGKEVGRYCIVDNSEQERKLLERMIKACVDEDTRELLLSIQVAEGDQITAARAMELEAENRDLKVQVDQLKKTIENERRDCVEIDVELERLQETLWALTMTPWTDAAPGLLFYVKTQLHSGRVQLSLEEKLELHAHIEDGRHDNKKRPPNRA